MARRYRSTFASVIAYQLRDIATLMQTCIEDDMKDIAAGYCAHCGRLDCDGLCPESLCEVWV